MPTQPLSPHDFDDLNDPCRLSENTVAFWAENFGDHFVVSGTAGHVENGVVVAMRPKDGDKSPKQTVKAFRKAFNGMVKEHSGHDEKALKLKKPTQELKDPGQHIVEIPAIMAKAPVIQNHVDELKKNFQTRLNTPTKKESAPWVRFFGF